VRIARRHLLALCLTTSLSLGLVPGADAAPRGYMKMSDERTRTWAAWVRKPVAVRRAPSPGARRVGSLRTRTYHGSRELVVVLGEAVVRGRRWLRVRYSGLGKRKGWIPDASVSQELLMTGKRLVLDLSALRLRLMRGRRVLLSTRVGVGAPGSPTPRGRFYIRERLGPFANSNTVYGALAFGTSAFSPFRTDWPGGGQVGIHGTNRPSLLPGRISNGCVRLRNVAVIRLGRMLPVGTPLLVR
jgi:L,D-transpeptidase catalytic domain